MPLEGRPFLARIDRRSIPQEVLQRAEFSSRLEGIDSQLIGRYPAPTKTLLRKLYGFDYDGAAPVSLYLEFLIYSRLATETPTESGNQASPDELKKEMLEILDQEIQRLTILEEVALAANKRRGEYQTAAALIPDQGNLERIIRCETHLSREYDRLLNQLERVQRIRLGQPVPTIRLEI
jgi:hypothetical protein